MEEKRKNRNIFLDDELYRFYYHLKIRPETFCFVALRVLVASSFSIQGNSVMVTCNTKDFVNGPV